MGSDLTFLGSGWSFPPTFHSKGATVGLVAEERDVQQSIQIILGTNPGERPMNLDFGCNLREFVFEEVDRSLLTRIRDRVTRALEAHEPRITDIAVDVDRDDGDHTLLLVAISYRLRTSNSRFNLVYPFFQQEATTPPAVS